jgi:hypothetical protein
MTRMTVSLVVIMIEVTGGMAYVIPIMLGVIFAKIVGDAFSPNTIYLEAIRAQGYPLLDHKTKIVEDAAQEQTAADVLAHTNQGEITFAGAQQDAGGGGGGGIHSRRGGLYVVRLMGETVGSIDDFLHSNPFHGFPVVWEQNAPVGYIRRSIMVQVMSPPPPSSPKNESLIPTPYSAMLPILKLQISNPESQDPQSRVPISGVFPPKHP